MFPSTLPCMLPSTLPNTLSMRSQERSHVRSQVRSEDAPTYTSTYAPDCTRLHTPSLLDYTLSTRSQGALRYALKYAADCTRSHTSSLLNYTPPNILSKYTNYTMIPPIRTDPVWCKAQPSPVQMEGWTGLDHRLPVLDWTGLVWTSPGQQNWRLVRSRSKIYSDWTVLYPDRTSLD